MGSLPRPDLGAGPHREMVEALHDLHHRAGWPSLRRIATAAGISHTTVSHVFSSPRVPAWDNLRAVVEALDGDTREFHQRWLAMTAATAGPASKTPLVGRHSELAEARWFFRDGGRLLLLEGPAGAGKTRLMEALSTSADRLVLDAQCLHLSRGEPLMPVASAVRSALRVDEGRWVSDALARLPEFVAPALAHVMPELGSPDPSPDAEVVSARHRLFTALCLLLAALDADRPCLVQLDDLHWADDSTLDFVSFAVAYGEGPPVVGTWRLDDPVVPRAAVAWRSRAVGLPRVVTVPVLALGEAESIEQLRSLGVADMARARRLYERSRGLPLFTEHLARAAGTERLPERLADLLDQRLCDVPDEGRRVANALGVLDDRVEAELLPELTGLARDAVTIGLHQLSERHLLQQTTRVVALSHPLLAQASRDRMVATELADQHRRTASVLETQEGSIAAEIAAHWSAAGDVDRARPWEIRAALRAQDRWAMVEAADHWERALASWPPSLSRHEDPDLPRTTALLHAVTVFHELHEPRSRAIADAAIRQVDGLTGAEIAAILERAALIVDSNGNPEQALKLIERAAGMLEGLAPSEVRVDVIETQALLLLRSGQHREARAVAQRAAELCDRLGDDRRRPAILADLAILDMVAGDRAAMQRHLEASAPTAEQEHDTPRMMIVAVQRTFVLGSSGAGPDEVSAAARPALEAVRRWGIDTFPADWLRGNLAEALRLNGRIQEAAALLDHLAREHPHERHAASHLQLAALELARGQQTEALARAHAVADLPRHSLSEQGSTTQIVSEVELGCGQAALALGRLLELLETTRLADLRLWGPELLCLAARAGADLAESPQQHPPDVAARLRRIRDDAGDDPFTPLDTIPSRRALHAQWVGELARLDGRPQVEPWSAAARHWDNLRRPFDAAYCRLRAAQACAELGEATTAGRLLRRGLTDAREHTPLMDALAGSLLDLANGQAPRLHRD